jgi:DNA-binding MarR family transcriptional regulator
VVVAAGKDDDHIDRIIRDWAREWPELDTTSIAVVGRVMRAARYLAREVDRELAAHGLNVHEFNALSALRRQGVPYSLTPKKLSRGLLLSSGGVSKLIERLETASLVVREPDPTDGRGVLVRLTQAGRERQEEAMLAHAANERELLAPLDPADTDQLSDALRRLLAAFEGGEGRARLLIRQPQAVERP